MADQNTSLSPPPLATPLAAPSGSDPNGGANRPNQQWAAWFNQVQQSIADGATPGIISYANTVYARAARRPNWDKHGERVSVLDFIPSTQHAAIRSYSTTDDHTPYFAAAHDSLPQGGTIWAPWGKYNVHNWRITKAIDVIGEGPGGYSTTSTNAWFMPTVFVNLSQADDLIVLAIPGGGNLLSGARLRNFHMVGNKDVAGATAGALIKIVCGPGTAIRQIEFYDLWMRSAFGHGLQLTGNIFECDFYGLMIFECGGDGIYEEQYAGAGLGPSNIRLRDGCTCQGNRYGWNNQSGGVGHLDEGGYYAENRRAGIVHDCVGSYDGTRFEGNWTEGSSYNPTFAVTVGSPNLVTGAGQRYALNDLVTVHAPGTAPLPLTNGSSYYVVGNSATAIQVASTPFGEVLFISTPGSGTFSLSTPILEQANMIVQSNYGKVSGVDFSSNGITPYGLSLRGGSGLIVRSVRVVGAHSGGYRHRAIVWRRRRNLQTDHHVCCARSAERQRHQ